MKFKVTYYEKKSTVIDAVDLADADRIARGVWDDKAVVVVNGKQVTGGYVNGAWSRERGCIVLEIVKLNPIPGVDPTPAVKMELPSLIEELEQAA